MIEEVLLDGPETKRVYEAICASDLKPFDEELSRKSMELFYEFEGSQYRLIYDRSGDYFCDLIYKGNYK